MQRILETLHSKRIGSILAVLLFLCFGAVSLQAASGTWTNDLDSIWSDGTNWLDGIVADGADNTATFSNSGLAPNIITLDSSRTLGNLTFGTGTFTISNTVVPANTLTLQGTAKPVVNVQPSQVATISTLILAGANGMTVSGGGTLNLYKENTNAANTIAGDLTLNDGSIVQVQGLTEGTLNFANNLTVTNFSTVTFNNGTLSLRPAANTSPEYGVFNGNLIVPAGASGTLILPPRFSGSASDSSTTIGSGLGGTLTGAGTFTVDTMYVRANVVGDWSAFTGQVNVVRNGGPSGEDKQLRMGIPAGLPNATLNLTGTTDYGMFYYRRLTVNTNYPVGILMGDNALAQLRGSPTAGFTFFWDVGAKHTNATDVATFAGSIANSAGPAGLIKRGAGTLILTGDSTFTGGTTVSSGVLQVGDLVNQTGTLGSGPINNLATLVIARPGTFNIPGNMSGAGNLTNTGYPGMGGTVIMSGSNSYSGSTTIDVGKIVFGTRSKLPGSVTVRDSAALGAMYNASGSTLSVGSLSFGSGCTLDVDFGVMQNGSATVISNTGALAMNGDITVNVTGFAITNGVIPILRYASRSGTGNFVLGTLPDYVTGYSFNDDTVNKEVTLTVTSVVDRTLVWQGNTANEWSVNPTYVVWREVFSGLLTNYYDGAKVRFDDTSTGATNVSLNEFVTPFSVIVDNTSREYTISGAGSITEAMLTKRGNNTLVISTANGYTRGTEIEAGTVVIADGATASPFGTGSVTNNSTIIVSNTAAGVAIANFITGTGSITQVGAGVATISGNNSYSGGLFVTPGTTLGYNSGNAAGIGGNLTVNAATVNLNANPANTIGQVTVITNATFTAGANRVVEAPIRGTNVWILFSKTALITLNADFSGVSGVITNDGTGGLRFNSGGGNNCTGASNVLWVLNAGAGWVQARNASTNDLGAVIGSGILSAAQSADNSTVIWVVGGLNTSTSFEGIIHDGADPAWGTLRPTRYTQLRKVGTGTWTLNNATLTYRSDTVVSNGTLALTGTSMPANSTNWIVAAPGVLDVTGRSDGTLALGGGTVVQTLRGDGNIQGTVTLGANGRLAPGFSIGTLTVSGPTTLGGITTMEFNTTNSPNSDRLVAPSITYGGTLNLTALNADIRGTNVLQLFSGSLAGSFSAVNTPTIPDVTFDTSKLTVDGTVTVIGPPPMSLERTNLVYSVAAGQLTLSWPSSHIGWRLQAQTNSLTEGLTTNWYDVDGSTATNLMTFPINPADGTVFYRMMVTAP